MAFVKPQYSKGKINAAGDILITALDAIREAAKLVPEERDLEFQAIFDKQDEALLVINKWRSCHSFPLQCIKMTLLNRAKKIDQRAIVAQRLKRLSSIRAKLERAKTERSQNMDLARMHDIGGCRAIMQNMGYVNRLITDYEESAAKNPNVRNEFVRKYDYIQEPKSDGYRGVHLVYKYRSPAEDRQEWNGLRIEIQIRSRLQHAWATAVESVDTFTKQALKSNVGNPDWKRFFALMGSVIAIKETRPTVPGTPGTLAELKPELKALSEQLDVQRVMRGWGTVVQHAISEEQVKAAPEMFLLVLTVGPEPDTSVLTIRSFSKEQLVEAQRAYGKVEKETADDPSVQAVLVSVDSVKALPRAYPNYFLDTEAFLREVQLAVGR